MAPSRRTGHSVNWRFVVKKRETSRRPANDCGSVVCQLPVVQKPSSRNAERKQRSATPHVLQEDSWEVPNGGLGRIAAALFSPAMFRSAFRQAVQLIAGRFLCSRSAFGIPRTTKALHGAATTPASTWARGLPNFLPLARALRKPALPRSWISDRSNSAIAPMIWNIRRPEGVERSRLSHRCTRKW